MDKNNVVFLKPNLKSKTNIKKSKVSLYLKKEHEGESVIYTLGKNRKNNPRKIARVEFDEENIYELLIINNLKVKKNGNVLFNSNKEKLDSSNISLKKIIKWFHDSEYKVKAMPYLLLIKNEMMIEGVPMCNLLEVKYTENGIRKFILEFIQYSQNVKEKRVIE